MAIDAVVTVLYNGEPLVEVDTTGQHVLHSSAVGHMRVSGALFDVDTRKLKALGDQVKVGYINPYRDALMMNHEKVYAEISLKQRRGMTRRDVKTVMDAVAKIASRSVQ